LRINNAGSWATNDVLGIDFRIQDSLQAFVRAIVTNSPSAATELAFGTANGGNLGTEAMRINRLGNVGIGRSDPGQKLHIQGNVAITDSQAAGSNDLDIRKNTAGGPVRAFIYNTNTTPDDASDAQLYLYVNAVGGQTLGDPLVTWAAGGITDWSAGIDNSDADKWKLSRSNVLETNNVLTADTSGNVGIGTTGPQARQHNQTSARSTAFDAAIGSTWHDLIIQNPDSTQNAAVGIAFELNSTYHSNAGTGIAAVKSTASSDYGADLAFITRPQSAVASEKMRITSAGNVGIGTTTPTARLSVVNTSGGATSAIYPTNAAGIFEYGGGNGVVTLAGNSTGDMGYVFSNPSSAYDGLVGYNNSGRYMYLSTAAGERVRINSSGNVGIGTTTPARKLDLYDGKFVMTDPDVLQTNTNTSHTLSYLDISPLDGSAGGVKIWGASDADGSGSTAMMLNAFMSESDPTDSIPAMIFRSHKTNGATADTVLADAETAFQFQNHATALVSILGNGNVGIGTTNPGRTLDVQQAQAFINVKSTTGTNAVGVIMSNQSGSSELSIGVESSGGNSIISGGSSIAYAGIITTPTNSPIVFGTNNVGRMTILGGGNVGIGTTGPSKLLHLSANTDATGLLVSRGTTENARLFAHTSGGYLQLTNGSGTQTIQISGQANDVSYINTGGNVGIGTTGPSNKLHIDGSDVALRVSDATADSNELLILDNKNGFLAGGAALIRVGRNSGGDSSVFGFDYDTNAFQVRTGTGGILATFKNSTGNVGIGTTGPSAKLHINGTFATGDKSEPALNLDKHFNLWQTNGTVQNGFTVLSYKDDNLMSLGVPPPPVATDKLYRQDVKNNGVWGDQFKYWGGDYAISATPSLGQLAPSTDYTVGIWAYLAPANASGVTMVLSSEQNFTVKSTLRNASSVSGQWVWFQQTITTAASGNVRILPSYPRKDSGDANIASVYIVEPILVKGDYSNVALQNYAPYNEVARSLRVYDSLTVSGTQTFNSNPSISTTIPYLIIKDTDSLWTSNGVAGYVTFQDQNNTEYGWVGDGGGSSNVIKLYAGAQHSLQLASGGADALTILTNGNVGIGTTGPGTNLEVYKAVSDGTVTNLMQLSVDHGTNKDIVFSMGRDGFIGGDYSTKFTSRMSSATSYGSTLQIQTHSGGSGTFNTGLFMDNGGNVGIGTTGPNEKLTLFDSSSGSVPRIGIDSSTATDANYPGFVFKAGSTFKGGLFRLKSNDAISLWTPSLEAVTILTGGNVGIGTASPAEKLQVKGGRVQFQNGDGDVARAAGLTVTVGGGAYSAGTDPGDGNRHLSLISSGANKGVVLTLRNTSRSIFWDIVGQGTGNDRLDFNTYNAGTYSTKFTLEGSSGNVGIGTASPNMKLHIYDNNSDVTGFRVQNVNSGAGAQVQNVLQNDVNSLAYYGIASSNYNGFPPINGGKAFFGSYLTDTSIFTQTAKDIIFSTNAAEIMRITSGGHVGIGTANPSTNKLQVTGSAGKTVGGTSWSDLSDARLKNVLAELTGSSLDTLMKLRPIKYEWNDLHKQLYDPDGKSADTQMYGFLAQEIKEIIPQMVTVGGDGYYWYNPSGFEAILTAGVQELNTRTRALVSATSTPSIYITASSTVAIGTTTPDTSYKLYVEGDAAATSFVNISTRDAKKDIEYLDDGDKRSVLEKLKTTGVATYLYTGETCVKSEARNPKSETNSNTQNPNNLNGCVKRLGLIAEEAPAEILSANRKGVDVYKLATFILAGVQEQQKQLDSLKLRVDKLEALVASSTPNLQLTTNNLQLFTDYLASLGAKFTNGLAEFKNVIVEKLTAKNVEVSDGITMKDKTTGEYYCVIVDNGVLKNLAGPCSSSTTSNSQLSTNNSSDTTPPTITIIGNNPANVEIGAVYVDLGVTVTDNHDTNLGAKASLDNEIWVEVGNLSFNTASSTTSTIYYKATDGAGNIGTASRTVVVGDGGPGPGPGPDAGPGPGADVASDPSQETATTTPATDAEDSTATSGTETEESQSDKN
jgi:hypothetical protein